MERISENVAPPDEITLAAKTDSISALVDFVATHAQAAFNDEKVKSIALATEEALHNIIHFAYPDKTGNITISCTFHDSGSLIINIVDYGAAFNMLLAGTFPETEDFFEAGKIPSTKLMKKAIKNIEYRRGTDMNTLVFTISPDKTFK